MNPRTPTGAGLLLYSLGDLKPAAVDQAWLPPPLSLLWFCGFLGFTLCLLEVFLGPMCSRSGGSIVSIFFLLWSLRVLEVWLVDVRIWDRFRRLSAKGFPRTNWGFIVLILFRNSFYACSFVFANPIGNFEIFSCIIPSEWFYVYYRCFVE